MAQGTTRGVPIDIDPLLAADSDLLVPSQKAIKTYADTKISSVSATSPMVSTGGTSPTLSIPQATSSADGYLSSTDWSIFNNKQNALNYTPFRFVNATQATYLGAVIGLAETPVAQTTILGGTFNATDFMKMFFKLSKPATAFAVTTRIRVNTTNTLVGATQIAVFNIAASNTYSLMPRHINLFGGNGYSYNFNSSLISDVLATNTAGTTFTYDTTNDLFVFFTIQLGNVADSITFQLANISN
jgi:hypothetical protein